MKSTKKVVTKAVKETKKASRAPRPIDFPDLPYRSKNWRKIMRAVDEVVAERKAREAKAK